MRRRTVFAAKRLYKSSRRGEVDEDELARLMRRGANAWKDVPDATAWVDDLRGGTH